MLNSRGARRVSRCCFAATALFVLACSGCARRAAWSNWCQQRLGNDWHEAAATFGLPVRSEEMPGGTKMLYFRKAGASNVAYLTLEVDATGRVISCQPGSLR